MGGLLPCLARAGEKLLEASFIGVQGTTNELSNGFDANFEEINVEGAIPPSQLLVTEL